MISHNHLSPPAGTWGRAITTGRELPNGNVLSGFSVSCPREVTQTAKGTQKRSRSGVGEKPKKGELGGGTRGSIMRARPALTKHWYSGQGTATSLNKEKSRVQKEGLPERGHRGTGRRFAKKEPTRGRGRGLVAGKDSETFTEGERGFDTGRVPGMSYKEQGRIRSRLHLRKKKNKVSVNRILSKVLGIEHPEEMVAENRR